MNWKAREWELKNRLEDFDFAEKQAISNFGWSIDTFDETDYYRMSEVMSAKGQNNRAVDPLSALVGIRTAQSKRKGGK